MSELSHFQKYAQRENHITNNVVLMLRMLYKAHPAKLQTVIDNLLSLSEHEGLDFRIGPVFEQQFKGTDSIPDAVISQLPFSITIEVKPGKNWNRNQLERHINSVNNANIHANNFLLLLSKTSDPQFDKQLKKQAQKHGVLLLHSTYDDLINAIEDDAVIGAHEVDLLEIATDFRNFLSAEDLLDDPYVMFAFGCSKTLKWNLKNKIYYDDLSRPTKIKVLTGFYADRCIHALGKISATVVGYPEGGFEVENAHGNISNEDLIAKVKRAAKSAPHEDFNEPLRWYVYDELFETRFIKDTPYGYFQGVWFYLGFYLDDDIAPDDIEAMAKDLRDKKFDKSRGWE